MKFIKFWGWIKSLFKRQKAEKIFIPDDDIYGMVKHNTQRRYAMGRRIMREHNNRKRTNGRYIQYVTCENGITKPIYHFPG